MKKRLSTYIFFVIFLKYIYDPLLVAFVLNCAYIQNDVGLDLRIKRFGFQIE